MQFSVATWNINSVRLRIAHVVKVLSDCKPDVLCLQETKCPDDLFPAMDIIAAGYPYIVQAGQKGYNGVAILSRYPFSETSSMSMCGRNDARHICATLGKEAGKAAGITIHNFYVPAGGDVPDVEENPKFAHKLQFLEDMRQWGGKSRVTQDKAILVGDLNIAPLPDDVWSHKQLLNVVSHTPIECETLENMRQETGWVDALRSLLPEPEKLYTWWSYRSPKWETSNKGRRLDHIWVSSSLSGSLDSMKIVKETRGWERPSDHVPVILSMQIP